MQAVARTTDRRRDVVEHRVGLLLLREKLDVGVEQVALRHVDPFRDHLVHELEHSHRDGGLACLAHVQELAFGELIAQHDPVELGDVPRPMRNDSTSRLVSTCFGASAANRQYVLLIRLRPRRNLKAEALALHDGLDSLRKHSFDLGCHGLRGCGRSVDTASAAAKN